MNAAHLLNQRIEKPFCFRPLTDILTRKVKCPTGRASFWVKFPTVRSLTRVRCPGIARGGWAVLELTGTLKRARQSFTFEYKLKVIARADEIGNRAAAREFEIDESMIRYWRKKKDVKTKLRKRQRS